MPVPLLGDRAAFDSMGYPLRHASDLEAGTAIQHLPLTSGSDGQIPYWLDGRWVPVYFGDIISGSDGYNQNFISPYEVDTVIVNFNSSMSWGEISDLIAATDHYVPAGRTLKFNFADGTYDLTDATLLWQGFWGGGRIEINGNRTENYLSLHTNQAVILDGTNAGSNVFLSLNYNDVYVGLYNLKVILPQTVDYTGLMLGANSYVICSGSYFKATGTVEWLVKAERARLAMVRFCYFEGGFAGIYGSNNIRVIAQDCASINTIPLYGIYAISTDVVMSGGTYLTGSTKDVETLVGSNVYPQVAKFKTNTISETFEIAISSPGLSANRSVTLPDKDGTVAFIDDIVSGSDGVTTFLGLTDTPATYTGQAGKTTVVNATEDAIEFVDMPTSGSDGGTPLVLSDFSSNVVINNATILYVPDGFLIDDNGDAILVIPDKADPIATFEYINECYGADNVLLDFILGTPLAAQIYTSGSEGLHQGVYYAETPSVTGEWGGFNYYEYFRLDWFETLYILFYPELYSNARIMVGLINNSDVGVNWGGYYLEALSTDTNYFFVEKYNDVETRVDTGIAKSIGWCLLKIRRDTTGSIFFKLNDSVEVEVDIPDALGSDSMTVEIVIQTEEDVIKYMALDFISIKWKSNLLRYGSTS